MQRAYVQVVGCKLQSTRFKFNEARQAGRGPRLTRLYVDEAKVSTGDKRVVLKLTGVPPGAEFDVRVLISDPSNLSRVKRDFPLGMHDDGLLFIGTAEYRDVWVVTNLSIEDSARLLVRCRATGYEPFEVRGAEVRLDDEMIQIKPENQLAIQPKYRPEETGQFSVPWWWRILVVWDKVTQR